MKKILAVLVVGLSLFPLTSKSSQLAEARLWCCSLEFQRGYDPYDLFTLDLSTYDPQYSINGEVMPVLGDYTHGSYFGLDDGFDLYVGTIYFNVPTGIDANGNGFDDIYESSQSVSSTTTGTYDLPGWGSGSVQLQWSRAAGSLNGTCVINLVGLDSFTHSFSILEYKGALSYALGASPISGSIDLTQTGLPANHLQGPAIFEKTPSDPLNTLWIQSGTWTNSSAQTFNFQADYFWRDPKWPTNYYGYVTFDDGKLDTPYPDYQSWMLSIDDAHDRNQNGIPDFSDLRRPKLSLSRTLTNLQLSISGDVGTICDLQEIASLSTTNWQPTQSFTLTNDPHVLLVPLPSGAPKFWRLQAH